MYVPSIIITEESVKQLKVLDQIQKNLSLEMLCEDVWKNQTFTQVGRNIQIIPRKA